MIIDVPENIEVSFLNILNIAQASFPLDEEKNFTYEEKKCLKFIRELLGNDAFTSFNSKKEMRAANKDFVSVFENFI